MNLLHDSESNISSNYSNHSGSKIQTAPYSTSEIQPLTDANTLQQGTNGRFVSDEDLQALQLPIEFKNAEPLSIGEIMHIHKEKAERDEKDEDDIEMKESCKKGIKYAENYAKIKNKETIISIRSTLTAYNFSAVEIVYMMDLCPESAEEAKSLIPSLSNKFSDQDLQSLIDEIQRKISYEVNIGPI